MAGHSLTSLVVTSKENYISLSYLFAKRYFFSKKSKVGDAEHQFQLAAPSV
jgi:hypothetical protein